MSIFRCETVSSWAGRSKRPVKARVRLLREPASPAALNRGAFRPNSASTLNGETSPSRPDDFKPAAKTSVPDPSLTLTSPRPIE